MGRHLESVPHQTAMTNRHSLAGTGAAVDVVCEVIVFRRRRRRVATQRASWGDLFYGPGRLYRPGMGGNAKEVSKTEDHPKIFKLARTSQP